VPCAMFVLEMVPITECEAGWRLSRLGAFASLIAASIRKGWPCPGLNRSAAPADAAQAFVNRVVFLPHLLQRIDRCVAAGLGLALGGQRSFLARITGFPFGLGLDEPALLHFRPGGSGDQQAQQNEYEDIQSRRSFVCLFSIPRKWSRLAYQPALKLLVLFMCSQRIAQDTSFPVSANQTANWPPGEPVPNAPMSFALMSRYDEAIQRGSFQELDA
jgi:hypothetical protein